MYTDDPSDGRLRIKISPVDAKKILRHAAEFCEDMRSNSINKGENVTVDLSSFSYEVENFNGDDVFQILAENTTELTEVQFFDRPKPELLQCLFNRNKIKKIQVSDSNDFWRDIPTNSIENLGVYFIQPKKNMTSFKGVCITIQ